MKPKPYVIDVVDCSGADGLATADNLVGNNTATVRMGGMSNAVLTMIDRVIIAANSQQNAIRCLAFWGHGLVKIVDGEHKGLGLQFVSGGSENVARNALGHATIMTLHTRLAQLKAYFASAARVELRGCGVADGGDGGVEIMKRLAFIWGVKVHANTTDNVGMDWGTSFGSHTTKIVEVTPDGRVNMVNGIRYDART